MSVQLIQCMRIGTGAVEHEVVQDMHELGVLRGLDEPFWIDAAEHRMTPARKCFDRYDRAIVQRDDRLIVNFEATGRRVALQSVGDQITQLGVRRGVCPASHPVRRTLELNCPPRQRKVDPGGISTCCGQAAACWGEAGITRDERQLDSTIGCLSNSAAVNSHGNALAGCLTRAGHGSKK